ncbi:hypothetical protein NUSPORA_02374 [Nucleospora cyclopteri]
MTNRTFIHKQLFILKNNKEDNEEEFPTGIKEQKTEKLSTISHIYMKIKNNLKLRSIRNRLYKAKLKIKLMYRRIVQRLFNNFVSVSLIKPKTCYFISYFN